MPMKFVITSVRIQKATKLGCLFRTYGPSDLETNLL